MVWVGPFPARTSTEDPIGADNWMFNDTYVDSPRVHPPDAGSENSHVHGCFRVQH